MRATDTGTREPADEGTVTNRKCEMCNFDPLQAYRGPAREPLMYIRVYAAIAVCMTVASGCSSDMRASSDRSQASSSVPVGHIESAPASLAVENVSLADETLTLKYCVTNTSSHDIWVCATQNVFGGMGVQEGDIRIVDRTLWVGHRADVRQNVHIDGMVYAGYRRLSPGQRYSYMNLLPFPIQPLSLVYSDLSKFSQVVLDRITVEVGYFDEDLPALIQRQSLRYERDERVRKPRFFQKGFPDDPGIVPIPYLDPERWDGLALEKSVYATIVNVAVPGRVGPWMQLSTGEIMDQRDVRWRMGECEGRRENAVGGGTE